MKSEGCSIIFVNDRYEILLFLRDDKPNIPYPNMWDIPGGHVESNETPKQCIVREIKEEMGLDIEGDQLFSEKEFDDRIEYTFWQKANYNIKKIKMNEGQYLQWFTLNEIRAIELAYGFNQIVEDFFRKKPFCKGT